MSTWQECDEEAIATASPPPLSLRQLGLALLWAGIMAVSSATLAGIGACCLNLLTGLASSQRDCANAQGDLPRPNRPGVSLRAIDATR